MNERAISMGEALHQAEANRLMKVWPSVIHKQVIPLEDEVILMLPRSAKILSFGVQNGQICVWYQWYCYPGNDEKPEAWTFHIIGTGHEFLAPDKVYLATVQMPPFVWHIFQGS